MTRSSGQTTSSFPLEGAGDKLTSTISSPIQVHDVSKVPAKRAPKNWRTQRRNSQGTPIRHERNRTPAHQWRHRDVNRTYESSLGDNNAIVSERGIKSKMIYAHSIARAARYYPELVALSVGGRRLSFRELHRRIEQIAAELHRLGFKAVGPAGHSSSEQIRIS